MRLTTEREDKLQAEIADLNSILSITTNPKDCEYIKATIAVWERMLYEEQSHPV